MGFGLSVMAASNFLEFSHCSVQFGECFQNPCHPGKEKLPVTWPNGLKRRPIVLRMKSLFTITRCNIYKVQGWGFPGLHGKEGERSVHTVTITHATLLFCQTHSHSTRTAPYCQTQESMEGKQEQVQGIYIQRNTRSENKQEIPTETRIYRGCTN